MPINELFIKYHVEDKLDPEAVDKINEVAWSTSRIQTEDAYELASHAFNLASELDYKKGIADALMTTAQCDWLKGDFVTTIDRLDRCRQLYDQLKDQYGKSEVLNLFGGVYSKMSEYHKAINFFEKALEIRMNNGDQEAIARSLNSIGDSYMKLNSYDKALGVFKKALNYEHNNEMYKGIIKYNIAEANYWLNDIQSSQTFISDCLQIADRLDFDLMRIYSWTLQSKILIDNKEFDSAEKLLKQSLRLSESIGNLERTYHLHEDLSKVYENSGDYSLALQHFKKYQVIKDEVMNLQTSERLKTIEHRNEIEKAINEVQSIKKEKDLLQSAYEEINLIKQKLEYQNLEINDSIKYAKRIQEAILPKPDYISTLFKDHFIFYQPKEKLSGDFYWASQATTSHGEKFLMASVADCTGHGVPGALMSIIGNNFLRICEREETVNSPAEALDFVNKGLSQTLRQEYGESTVKDGMDMAFVAIDYQVNKIYFAGANSSIFIVSNNHLKEFRGDKQPVGAFIGDDLLPFTNNSIDFSPGDRLYLSSDGYFDQFGGADNKKFMKKRFKRLIEENFHEPMSIQNQKFKTEFNLWKGDLEQLDDICVFGILL